MPLYEYMCPQCEKSFTVFKKLVDYLTPAEHSCGTEGLRIISRPMIAVDYPAYISPASGRLIQGKKQHEDELKRTGCRLLEPGERNDMERRKKEADVKEDKMIDTMVEKTFTEMKG
jgi:putative FmdB family regulatory protein